MVLRDNLYKKLMELQPDHPDYWEIILDHLMPIIMDELYSSKSKKQILNEIP